MASRLSGGSEPSESSSDRSSLGDGVGIFGMRPLHLPSRRTPSEDDDPETVADRSRQKPIPTVHDDPTVQLSQGALAFLREESAKDPETVFDQRPEVSRWRAEIETERPPARLPQASGSEAGTTTLARAHLPEDLPLPESSSLWDAWFGSRALALLPLAIGAVAGLVFLLIVIAIWAGSP